MKRNGIKIKSSAVNIHLIKISENNEHSFHDV